MNLYSSGIKKRGIVVATGFDLADLVETLQLARDKNVQVEFVIICLLSSSLPPSKFQALPFALIILHLKSLIIPPIEFLRERTHKDLSDSADA